MTIHQTIKDQIKDVMRAKDQIKLDTLRGLSALFQSELIANPSAKAADPAGEFLIDDKALALIKRSVKQRKDSIEQFTKGGRADLAEKEQAELKILETYLPAMMPAADVKKIVAERISQLKAQGSFDPAAPAAAGKLTGMFMKELAGKAEGADVKAAIDEVLKM